MLQACTSSTSTSPTNTTSFAQTNLVSDTAAFAAAHTDPALANAWGIAFGGTGKPWISSNHGNVSTIYDTSGNTILAAVKIPVPGVATGGSPTGVVYNANASAGDFGKNAFIFSTEDGTIAGWQGGAGALIVSDQSALNAVYKGLAIVPSVHQIYATDFHNNTVRVFDKNFLIVGHFTDPSIPVGYSSFGIQNIHDTLYVTFARQKSTLKDDSLGVGIGYVDMFKPDGTLIGRFASNGNLNSPWGLALAPSSFGQFANAILVGNFGDGKITAFDHSGTDLGQLRISGGSVISIDGLWALSFNPTANSDPNKLFFTSGPFTENHGLFGYLAIAP